MHEITYFSNLHKFIVTTGSSSLALDFTSELDEIGLKNKESIRAKYIEK